MGRMTENVRGNVCRVRVNYSAWGLACEEISVVSSHTVRMKRLVLHSRVCLQFFIERFQMNVSGASSQHFFEEKTQMIKFPKHTKRASMHECTKI